MSVAESGDVPGRRRPLVRRALLTVCFAELAAGMVGNPLRLTYVVQIFVALVVAATAAGALTCLRLPFSVIA